MNAQTQRLILAGPAGALEASLDPAAEGVSPRGLAVVCHPHPLFGGTQDNKVVQTIARAFLAMGYRCARFNFRGVGASAGTWDEGRGESDDALAVIEALRQPGEPLALAGFSFGGFVAARTAEALAQAGTPAERLLLVGPATRNFAVPPVPEDTVVIHGELDDTVPLAATLDWARPQGLPVVVVPGGGHFFHGQLPQLRALVTRLWR